MSAAAAASASTLDNLCDAMTATHISSKIIPVRTDIDVIYDACAALNDYSAIFHRYDFIVGIKAINGVAEAMFVSDNQSRLTVISNTHLIAVSIKLRTAAGMRALIISTSEHLLGEVLSKYSQMVV